MTSNAAGDRARRALLEDAREEEAITVNQRALIDKILARYAAEFTVFRELLQNADDAGATHCELRFETQQKASASASAVALPAGNATAEPAGSSTSSLIPDFKATLQNWVFKNDGKPFGNDDWSRLRRIAEGNPDPDRIGAFGVGFYSLFSICEEPIVSSGDELMGFFWKGDALFTRRAKNAATEVSPSGKPWTTFFMSLREPAPFPDNPLVLSKFLATSLTFTTQVRGISLYWDDQLLCKLDKKLSPPRPMSMPGHLNSSSPARIMKVRELQSTSVQIDVQAMQLVVALAEKPKPRPSLTAALSRSAGGGLTSMLQSAFGFSSSTAKEKERERERQAAREREAAKQRETSDAASMLTSVSASIHLRIATAHINVSADKAFEREIERSTKKPPPKTTAFHIIFTGKEEYDASFPDADDADDDSEETGGTGSPSAGKASLDRGVRQIFQGLMPRLEEQGHAFIGFRTHQTSGFSGHIAARFIPTVERESLDFIDRYCAKWNSELLSMGGYVARAVYENELQEVGRIWTEQIGQARPADDNKDAKLLKERALHLMRFFTFRTSSPSSRVYSLFETAFFGASRQATISIMSTRGVKHSAAVRLPNALLADFVKDLAVIPPTHVEQAAEFVREVRTRNLVQDITMDDVFKELSGRALTPTEMVACLKWWISVASHPSYDISLRSRLLDNGVVSIPAAGTEGDAKGGKASDKIQSLRSVRAYLNPQRVPTDVPLPDSCLSYEVSKALSPADLSRVFGWGELSMPTWLTHVVALSSAAGVDIESNIQLSPAFSEKVLSIVARAWGSLPMQAQVDTSAILQPTTCVPTRKGMQKPAEAYFANVSLFSDLPIVAFPTAQVKGNLEKVLIALGVRRHVELQMIFNRLVAAGDWSHVDLVAYLAANKDTLSSIERDRLKKTAIFPKEGEAASPADDASGKPRIVRHRASQLYEPTDALKALKLPVLDWSGKAWKPSSEEAKFVFDLGLRRHPPLEDLLSLASNTADDSLRAGALRYLLDRFATVYRSDYTLSKASPYAFVPCRLPEGATGSTGSKRQLCKPTEAFTNSEAEVMGWPVVSTADVSPTDAPKLQLRANPTSSQLIGRLVNKPTRDEAEARRVFEYLASVPEFTLADYGILKTAEFIPVKQRNGKGDAKAKAETETVLVAPVNCYFGGNSSSPQFKDVFSYCDYGPVAGAFLRNCGVTNEPSIEEVAKRLVAEPERFYQLAGSTDAYLGILRQIATNWNRIRAPLRSDMKRSPFLLGSKRITQAPASTSVKAGGSKVPNLMDVDDEEAGDDEDEGDDPGTLVYALRRPSEVVIVDDANSHMLFGSSVFFAPHEDLLQEGLYEQLGSPRLSSLVEERYSAEGRLLEGTRRSEEVKALVLERTPLFLFEKRSTAKSEIRRDADWLKSALEVVEVDGAGLRLTRTLRFGDVQEVNVQKSSAMASLRGTKLTLFFSSAMEVDYFEVAMALNKFLLTRQRLQEVLLFMTLLSTSLRNLKRRGFHVDKILQQRKADREAAETQLREQRMQAELAATQAKAVEAEMAGFRKQVLSVFPDADPAYVDRLLRSQKELHVERTMDDMLQNSYPRRTKTDSWTSKEVGAPLSPSPSSSSIGPPALQQPQLRAGGGGGGLFSGFKSRFMQSAGSKPSSLADGTSSIERGPSLPGGWAAEGSGGAPPPIAAAGRTEAERPLGGLQPQLGSGLGAGNKPQESTAEVTPLSTIQHNVLRAIQASRPDASSTIKSQAQQTEIREASNTYCDTTGIETDLRLAGEVAGMKVFLNPSLDPAATLQTNHEALERLINRVYKPVGSIFGLDPRSLNVFCDVEGPSIAFNRGGTIYLNLRYYLAWHDDDVRAGRMSNPLVSTYFSVAHEIAHNVVSAHNAEHEWYFSAIAEKYIVVLAEYIRSVEGKV
ncbi:uncharacterized protein PFL1_03110 [Pseudozyma flocculosa PF-1]|uniref:Sacsin/Nov domain-containing protein n=2 Tax=Pseudozyma flocculosa TaxID=84751 RepID=A0A5C3F031_9BASI|nr:uncharacterized protein PFL1_03110 [Pseudozyma flocculosa PF-1]EPQ29355.1 hypothetical protein PFL1_03110 [Pseudozyma flocculosa PF-1]SPO37873.1 uncharacterized protein PSFLO_03350 [Pseudozyma flocculosa]